MSAIILVLSPIITSWLTEQVKKVYTIRFSMKKKMILRSLAATLSFAGVFTASLASGDPMPTDQLSQAISLAVETLLVFAATQIPYSFGKSKAKNGV